MTLSRRSGVGEATVRNASDARRRHRRCRRATPTQNPSDSWVGASLPDRTSEARTGASAPLHSYQVWPPSGSNAGSSNLRYRQRPILIKNLRISLSRKHVFLYSDSIGSETGRSLQPRRWQRQRRCAERRSLVAQLRRRLAGIRRCEAAASAGSVGV